MTLGIGDNRKDCFYIPVTFPLIRNYIDAGFHLEEFITRKLRHCQGSMLGTYLSNQYDFLMLQHEFIVIFQKRETPQLFKNTFGKICKLIQNLMSWMIPFIIFSIEMFHLDPSL